jgi:hypothetical protein
MPDLEFHVTGVEPVRNGLAPLLRFKLRVSQTGAGELEVQALILQAQIQIQAPQRRYNPGEQEKLLDIFGTPERWGQTMQNRFWTNASTTTGPFTESIETALSVPCTFDLDVLATKYFNGLDGGEVPLLFLFSGSIFYRSDEGRLQVQRISWERDCVYKMPVGVWRELMEFHYPNSAWVSLRRDVYDRLCAFRREGGLASWEEAIERLLPKKEVEEVKA